MIRKFIVSVFLLISSIAFSQVGININTQDQNKNTLLHISEDSNNPKGIIIPRLTIAERETLTTNIESTKETQNNNSLMIFNTDENCYNYWNTNKSKWESLCGGIGNAKFSFSCEDVTLHGNYIQGEDVSRNEYISIKIDNIEKIGKYRISAKSEGDKEIYFLGTGIFYSLGSQVVKLYAQGKPTKVSDTENSTNNYTIISSGSVDCSIQLTAQPPRAEYVMNCQFTTVEGEYSKGTTLTSNNTITLSVNVYKAGSYKITTDVVNGISFSKSDIFTAEQVNTTQPITLEGSGTPTVNNDFDITITSNTAAGNATCTAKIPIILPEMTIGIIGGTGDKSWNNEIRQKGFNGQTFGPSGKVKIKKINLNTSADANNAVEYLKSNNPDVILYYCDTTSAQPTDELADLLASYTKKGGVLIFAATSNIVTQSNILLQGIYGKTNPPEAISNTSTNNIYQINYIPNNAIVDGAFGDLSTKFWGEDNDNNGGNTIFVKNLPSTATQIASGNNPGENINIDPDTSVIWFDNSKNFAFLGSASGATNDASSGVNDHPALFDSTTGLPNSKLYGYWDSTASTSLGKNYVYNSALDLNLLAWALKKAADTGINEH